METIGTRLKILRESVGLPQHKIASILNITQVSINRYETNKATPPVSTFLWYADYFDVSMDYIFCRTDNPHGKLYNHEPKVIKEKVENNEELQQFIEMCFNPNSSMNERLKQALVEMVKGDKK